MRKFVGLKNSAPLFYSDAAVFGEKQRVIIIHDDAGVLHAALHARRSH